MQIPDIDISPFLGSDEAARRALARRIGATCETTGFLHVSGHGVGADVTEGALDAAKAFFAGDEALKRGITRRPGTYRGYIPLMPFARQRDPAAPPTVYEGFVMGEDPTPGDPEIRATRGLYAPNRWPEAPPGFREAVQACYDAMGGIARVLLEAFALALGREEDALTRLFARPLTNVSLLHYPARPHALGRPEDDVNPHRDTNAITVLLPGEEGGLQVQAPDGGWTAVPPRHGAFVVNIGNMMEIWSGGRFRSTLHRVHPPRDRERFSIGYFAVPDYDTTIAPLAGLPVTGAPEDMTPRHAGRDLAGFVANFDRQVRLLESPPS